MLTIKPDLWQWLHANILANRKTYNKTKTKRKDNINERYIIKKFITEIKCNSAMLNNVMNEAYS